MKRKKTEYCIIYLKENILIFDVFDYIQELASDTIDYLHEWFLVKNEKIIFNQKIIKDFLKKKIKTDFNEINDFCNKNNYNIFSFYSEKQILNSWSVFFENPYDFLKFCKKICKKNLTNFIENKKDIKVFQNINGYFLNFPCLIPSGEDEEFLQKELKNIKNPIDNLI